MWYRPAISFYGSGTPPAAIAQTVIKCFPLCVSKRGEVWAFEEQAGQWHTYCYTTKKTPQTDETHPAVKAIPKGWKVGFLTASKNEDLRFLTWSGEDEEIDSDD